jgi:hypothetical protein
MMKRHLDQTMDQEAVNYSMEEALELLTFYGQTRPSARRCFATLNSILQLRSPLQPRIATSGQGLSLPPANGHSDAPAVLGFDANGTHGYQQNSIIDWNTSFGNQNAAFEFLSDQWLMQPQLDSFNYLGI